MSGSSAEVAIVGVGLHPFGRHDAALTGMAMGAQACRLALADAGVSWADIGYAVGGSNVSGKPDTLVGVLGLTGVPFVNVRNGCATAGVMWLCDVSGPVLWGVVAFCLNFVPILGPFCGIVLFLAVGLISNGPAWAALMPAALYFGIHVLEGEIVTPMLLANRFTINPVAVILSLIFWYWMWGVPGAILAVPMLTIIKIVSDRLRPLRAFGHLLEG